jgi:hypothetical protein
MAIVFVIPSNIDDRLPERVRPLDASEATANVASQDHNVGIRVRHLKRLEFHVEIREDLNFHVALTI